MPDFPTLEQMIDGGARPKESNKSMLMIIGHGNRKIGEILDLSFLIDEVIN